jgi:hypothetical protein
MKTTNHAKASSPMFGAYKWASPVFAHRHSMKYQRITKHMEHGEA